VPAPGIRRGEDAGPVGPIPKIDEEPDRDGENGLTLYGAQPHLLLAMEPLHMLFARPQQCGLLNKLSKGCDKFRVSLYADDAAVFIRPDAKEVLVTEHILDMFASASGLVTNLVKTEFFPIRCEGINLHFLSQNNRHMANFPCLYLGLPLHYKKPSQAMLHLLIQNIGDRLPGWKREFLSYPGRELLVKSVLFVMPTYFLTVFKMPRWGISRIDRFRRSFLWKGQYHDNVRGGHYLINWQTCLLPKKFGGLGKGPGQIQQGFKIKMVMVWLGATREAPETPLKNCRSN
jgi:hypothetical protein